MRLLLQPMIGSCLTGISQKCVVNIFQIYQMAHSRYLWRYLNGRILDEFSLFCILFSQRCMGFSNISWCMQWKVFDVVCLLLFYDFVAGFFTVTTTAVVVFSCWKKILYQSDSLQNDFCIKQKETLSLL